MALVLSSAALTVPSSSSSSASSFAGNVDLVQQWDEATVGEWLKSVNCGNYRAVFASNNINGDALLDCDQTILKELGVTKVGDRIRIMVAVKALRAHTISLSKVLVKNAFLTFVKAARLEASVTSPQTATHSPTSTFGQFYSHSNRSTTTSPSIPARLALEQTPQSPGIQEQTSSRLHHQKSQPSIDGGGIMSIDHVRQVMSQ
jgi:mitogen-activated protein kinase kinase kinase